MTRAFVITLEVPSDADPDAILIELENALDSLPVVSINPWDSPGSSSSLPPSTPFPAL